MKSEMQEKKGEVVIYRGEDGSTALDVTLEGETVWLSLNQMAVLFQRDKSVVSRHLHSVFKEKELAREATVAKFATVQKEKDRMVERAIEYYNLDAIISVGYRVNSKRGTQFRIWATNVLRDDNALVALTLLVAESDPKQKDIMIKLIMNLISGSQD